MALAPVALIPAAHAKGYLAAGQAEVQVSTDDDDDVLRAVNGHLVRGACAPTGFEECISVDFATSPCGEFARRQIFRGNPSVCSDECGQPTLDDCADPQFHRSLCGAVDAYRRSLEGPTPPGGFGDNGEGPNCPIAEGTCGALLCQEFGSGPGRLIPQTIGARPVVLPLSVDAATGDPTRDLLSLEENGWAQPDVTASVDAVLEAPHTAFAQDAGGTGVHYWSRMLRDQASFIGDFTFIIPQVVAERRDAFAAERAAWEGNGNTFDSCEEYVYEKYYDFSLFEDASRQVGIDFRKVFDIAYAPLDAGNGPRSAIASRALSGIGLTMRNGAALNVEIAFAEDVPKNVFFSYQMPGAIARQADIDEWEANDHAYTVELGGQQVRITTARPLFKKHDGSVITVVTQLPFVPMDGPLFGALQNRALHDESFAYHRDMAEALADQPDEVLYIYDRLKDDLIQLMARRRAIEMELAALNTITGDEALGYLEVNQNVFDPSIVENPADAVATPFDDVIQQQRTLQELSEIEIGRSFSAARVVLGRALAGQSLLGGAALGAQNRSASGGGQIAAGDGRIGRSVDFLRGAAGATNQGAGFATADRGFTLGYADPLVNAVVRLFGELVAVDAEIEVAMQYGRVHGCVEPDTLMPCDWSPRDFAEAVDDQLLVAREFDHQRCVDFTANDFDALRLRESVAGRFSAVINPETDIAALPLYPVDGQGGGLACTDAAYNTSQVRFERYTGCRDAWRRLIMQNINAFLAFLNDLLGDAKDLIDPVTGDIRPNQSTSDSDSFGDDTFGASYSYSAGWAMQLPPEGTADNRVFCDTEPQVHGQFNVDARIFGAEANIVDAGLEAGLGPSGVNRASMEILGVSIIDVARTSAVPTAQFNLIYQDSGGDFDEYFSASATFMVGPVPLTVSAGAGGVIAATVEARGGDRPGGAGCAQGDLAIEGNFVPSYMLMGFASAGIDALVVEAGIKIDLLIVGLSFPLRTALQFDGAYQEGRADANVTLTNDLDMVLSILGGRMAAYVEVCFVLCEEWDFTIFEWAPTRLSKNLFHSTLDFSMKGILSARANLPVPTVPGEQL